MPKKKAGSEILNKTSPKWTQLNDILSRRPESLGKRKRHYSPDVRSKSQVFDRKRNYSSRKREGENAEEIDLLSWALYYYSIFINFWIKGDVFRQRPTAPPDNLPSLLYLLSFLLLPCSKLATKVHSFVYLKPFCQGQSLSHLICLPYQCSHRLPLATDCWFKLLCWPFRADRPPRRSTYPLLSKSTCSNMQISMIFRAVPWGSMETDLFSSQEYQNWLISLLLSYHKSRLAATLLQLLCYWLHKVLSGEISSILSLFCCTNWI